MTGSGDRWYDLSAMVQDIREYVRNTGHEVMSSDSPAKLLVGFETKPSEGTPKWWQIGLISIREDTSEESATIRTYLSSGAGRVALAQVLNRGEDLQPFQAVRCPHCYDGYIIPSPPV